VEGAWRFLNRVWRLVVENRELLSKGKLYDGIQSLSPELRDIHRKTHQTIKKVTADIEDRFHFNTAISAVMELFNMINQFLNSGEEISEVARSVTKEAVDTMIVLLHPVVPHITEELWEILGHSQGMATVSWLSYREEALERESRLVVIQVNGKVRSRIEVPVSLSEKEIQDQALTDKRIQHFIGEKEVRRVVVVQNKLVNVVV